MRSFNADHRFSRYLNAKNSGNLFRKAQLSFQEDEHPQKNPIAQPRPATGSSLIVQSKA
jgi:hypothetical protein